MGFGFVRQPEETFSLGGKRLAERAEDTRRTDAGPSAKRHVEEIVIAYIVHAVGIFFSVSNDKLRAAIPGENIVLHRYVASGCPAFLVFLVTFLFFFEFPVCSVNPPFSFADESRILIGVEKIVEPFCALRGGIVSSPASARATGVVPSEIRTSVIF